MLARINAQTNGSGYTCQLQLLLPFSATFAVQQEILKATAWWPSCRRHSENVVAAAPLCLLSIKSQGTTR